MNFYHISTEAGDLGRILKNDEGDLQMDLIAADPHSAQAYVASPIATARELEDHIRDVKAYPHFLAVRYSTEDELLNAGVI